MDQSFCPKNSAESYLKSITTRNFKAIKSILLELSCDMKISIFFSKTSQQNGFKFLEIIPIYILHDHDFFQKIDRLVWA